MQINYNAEKHKYWVAVVSKDHASMGVNGGYMQVCHGKSAPLKRIRTNDWILVYSPKLSMENDVKCQAFTSLGQVVDEHIYPFKMAENFIPFRRNIKFFECNETSILPLIQDLKFIQNKKLWGYPFRMGFFEINENDFNLITSKMLKNEIKRQYIQL